MPTAKYNLGRPRFLWLAWAPAGGIPQILTFKTSRLIGRPTLYNFFIAGVYLARSASRTKTPPRASSVSMTPWPWTSSGPSSGPSWSHFWCRFKHWFKLFSINCLNRLNSRLKFIFGVTPVIKKCSACGAGLVEIARSVRRLSVLPTS